MYQDKEDYPKSVSISGFVVASGRVGEECTSAPDRARALPIINFSTRWGLLSCRRCEMVDRIYFDYKFEYLVTQGGITNLNAGRPGGMGGGR